MNDSALLYDISVIIPSTRPDLADRCLKGFEKQRTRQTFEVLIVGNVENIQVDDYSINLRALPTKNMHSNYRRNLGISKSRSDLIGFIDDDAIPDEYWVENALVNCSPADNIMITGYEKPVGKGETSRLVYSISRNFFSEFTRAHLNEKKRDISWDELIFCNCVVPKRIFETFGMLRVDIPWDLDDYEFCFRVRQVVEFKNVPELLIQHDRYPDSIARFLAYKWKLRIRTGEKVAYFPKIYCRILPVMIIVVIPWLIVASMAASDIPVSVSIIILFMGYLGFLATQFSTAKKSAGKHWYKYLVGLVGIHLVTGLAVQLGCFLGGLKKIYSKIALRERLNGKIL